MKRWYSLEKILFLSNLSLGIPVGWQAPLKVSKGVLKLFVVFR
jgi:hypothetical protein